MRAERKKTLMIVGGVATLIAITVFIALLLFDINSYKSKIETAASETTGLDVRINGKMGLSFFPFGLSAKDIHFANKGDEILSLEHLKLRAELSPPQGKTAPGGAVAVHRRRRDAGDRVHHRHTRR